MRSDTWGPVPTVKEGKGVNDFFAVKIKDVPAV